MAWLLIIWGGVRFIVDGLESMQATAKYAQLIYRYGFRHFAVPNFFALLLLLVGVALVFSKQIDEQRVRYFGEPNIDWIRVSYGPLLFDGQSGHFSRTPAPPRSRISIVPKSLIGPTGV